MKEEAAFTEQQMNAISELIAHAASAETAFTSQQIDEIKSLVANANTSTMLSDQQVSQIKNLVTNAAKAQREYNAKRFNKVDKHLNVERMFWKGPPSDENTRSDSSASTSSGCSVSSDETVRGPAARVYWEAPRRL